MKNKYPKNVLTFLVAFLIQGLTSATDASAQTQIQIPLGELLARTPTILQSHKQIPIATTVKGTVTTPIVWTDISNPQETRATITINESLKYVDGDIALPENSSLIVEVNDWDDAGFVSLRTVALAYKDSKGQFKQCEIPPGALFIRDQENQPLAFKTEESEREYSILADLVDEAVDTTTRELPFPGRLNSVVSRTIRDSRRLRRSNGEEVYYVENETPVLIYVNKFFKCF
jgi:hypothetical protein